MMRGFLLLLVFLLTSDLFAAPPVNYDIVYVRQPRYGDNTNTTWPEVFHPANLEPAADLILLHPNGNEEVLVNAGNGAVTDPFVSFDAKWVYYSYFPDPANLNTQRGLPYGGADIFRVNLATRQIQQLTFGEFTPNTGAGNWDESNPVNPPPQFNKLGYGILNLGPVPVAGEKIAFRFPERLADPDGLSIEQSFRHSRVQINRNHRKFCRNPGVLVQTCRSRKLTPR